MNYIKNKLRTLLSYYQEKYSDVVVDGVTFNLEDLNVIDSTELIPGQAYTCKLVAKNGKYLPSTISVEGTTSTYGFMYDHTTGIIYIPSDEVIGSIVITAEASDVNWNVPAQFKVKKITSDVYHTDYLHEQQHFIMFTVTPSRGSTVSVTYGGLTKTVTGDLTTDVYNSKPIEVFFGTYHAGAVDEVETPESGIVTISGAYESFDMTARFQYNDDKNEKSADILLKVVSIGAPRYLSYHSVWAPFNGEDSNIVFNTPIQFFSSSDTGIGVFGCNGTITFNKMPFDNGASDSSDVFSSSPYIFANANDPSVESTDSIYYDNGSIKAVDYNIDLGQWLNQPRKNYVTYANGDTIQFLVDGNTINNIVDLTIPDSCTSISSGSFYGFDSLNSVEFSKNIREFNPCFTNFLKSLR